MKLSELIKTNRKKHELSLREFAKKCDLSHTYIEKLETGVDVRSNKPVMPTIDTMQKLANAMNMTLADLLTKTGYIDASDNSDKVQTIAVHHDGNDYTEDEIEEIEKFKDFVKTKRKHDK